MVGQIRQSFRRKLNWKNWYFYVVATHPYDNSPFIEKENIILLWSVYAVRLAEILTDNKDIKFKIRTRVYFNYWKARKDYIKRGGK